jgi:DNA repair protein RecO (recombination protein O)
MIAGLSEAYVLHTRPFRDTSLIVEFFSKDHGRWTVLAKGARKNPRWKGWLQPFTALWVQWRGKSELPLLTTAEPQPGAVALLHGNALLSGFYLNELLIRLLEKHDPFPELFTCYQETLLQLTQGPLEIALRRFEKRLLQELGYGLVLDRELASNEPLEPEQYYQYRLEQGAVKATDFYQRAENVGEYHYLGKHLLALHTESFDTPESLRDAKRLTREALGVLLNHKPLRSRELFSFS